MNCIHYWRCEEAHGPTSNAVCKHCGEVRLFYNTIGALFDGDGRNGKNGNYAELRELSWRRHVQTVARQTGLSYEKLMLEIPARQAVK